MILDQDEVDRVNRARLAMELRKFPHEIDEWIEKYPLDYLDIIEVMKADNMVADYQRQKAEVKAMQAKLKAGRK